MIAPSKVLVADGAAYPKQSTTNSCAQVYSNATHPMLHGAQGGVLVSTATDRSRQFDQNHLFFARLQGFLWRARQDSNLRPSLFVVRFFERDAVGYGAKYRYLEVFGGIRRDAAVSASRQRPRQRDEIASKE